MRLFLATDLDDSSRDAIAALQWRLVRSAGDCASLKWTTADQLHLTLVFIGEADELLTAKIIAAVQRRPAQAAFDAAFDRLGMFPPRGAPRVLWLGVGAGAAEMMALQRDFAERVDRLGIPLDRRPFHPHLTLARWRESRPADRRLVDAVEEDGPIVRVRVDHVTLYRSQLSSAGSVYTPVARVNLHRSAGE